jgi:tape measure domain-containing protein
MQSGGQGAGIQLQVGLDLAYFRGQLPLLSKEAAGHLLTFGVRFNRQDIVTQFKTLDRYVNNKKFNIEIKSNLKAEIKAANELAKLLQSMPAGKPGTPGAIYNRTSGTEVRTAALNKLLRSPSAGGFNATQITKLAEAAIKAGIEGIDINASATKLRSTLRDAFQQAGDDSSRGLINALIDGRTAVGKAAAGLAEETLNTLRTSLQTQSPSKKTEKIGRDVGKGFEIGALSSMDNAFDALENKMRQRGKILDTVARGIFRMLGMDPAAMLQQAREQRATPVRTPIAGLLPSFTSRGTREETIRQLSQGGGGGGEPSVAQGPGMLALSNEALGRRVSAILQEYFKVAEVQVRESFNPRELKQSLNVFSYIVQSLRDAETRTKQARVAESVDSLMRTIENAIKVAHAQVRNVRVSELAQRPTQGMLSGTRIAGLLSPEPAGRYRGGRMEETQSELFARREREARMRSAQRETRILSERGGALPGTTFMGDDFVRKGGRDRVTGSGQPPQRGGALAFPGGPSTQLPSGYFENVKKFNQAVGLGKAATDSFSASQIPFIGGLKNIASEFGQATKQVLLYGTAYKGLAFITSLPGQILNAAKGQQQFNNAMQVATQASGTYAKELLFVDNVQRAFGLDLETTRTGFTRLYASMSPAGFDSGSIEKLFVGISSAMAALQLTPANAERVIYAFGQMASKGQLMSEELKGQLGDVLPGALAIFASAAGKSIKDFNKDMEDGMYSGEKFRDLMSKVTEELITRFGSGASAAGRSLQGLINIVKGDFTRTLESFAPLANSAAESILKPLGGALRQLSTAAKLATGERGRKGAQITQQERLVQELGATVALGGPDVEKAKEQYLGAKQSLEALKIELENLNELAKDPVIAQQAKDIQAFTEEIGKAANFVKNFTLSIGSVLSPTLNFLGTNLTSVIATISLLGITVQGTRLALLALAGAVTVVKGGLAVIGFLGLVKTLGSFSAALATSGTITKTVASIYTALGIQATAAAKGIVLASGATLGLRAAIIALMATTGIGLLVALIGTVGGAFLTMGDNAKKGAEDAKQAAKDMAEAARTGNVPQVEASLRQANAEAQLIQDAQKIVSERSNIKPKGPFDKYSGPAVSTLTPGQLSEEEKGVLALAGISLPDKGATRKELLKQLNDLLAVKQSVLRQGPSQLKTAKRQRARTGEAIPSLGIESTDKNEDKGAAQRAKSLLDAIEQREEAIANARKQKEETIAQIRKNAAEGVARMERDLADQRQKIEREIAQIKRRDTDDIGDIERQIRIARGEDRQLVENEQKIVDIFREERDGRIQLSERIADEEQAQARNIADFQKKIAKELQDADQAHTKQMGEIQRNYAKQVAKLIEEGTGKAAKKIEIAARLYAMYLERATLQQQRVAAGAQVIPEPVMRNGRLDYQDVPSDVVTPRFKEIDQNINNFRRQLQSQSVGDQFAKLLGDEGGFEDIAGLKPLPVQKMLNQAARPFQQLWKQIGDAANTMYEYNKREQKEILKPNPARAQKVLGRIQNVEQVRQNWNPLEAESRARLNQTNPTPRSKPSSMSLADFRDMLHKMQTKLLTETLSSLSWQGGVVKGDLSIYLTEGQRAMIRSGVADLIKIHGPELVEGMLNGAFRAAIRHASELEKIKVKPRGGAVSKPLESLGGDEEWLKRFMEQSEPPQIIPGVQNRIEGAFVPGGSFDTSKVATDFGTIAAASILRGVFEANITPGATSSALMAQSQAIPTTPYKVGDRVGYDRPFSQQVDAPSSAGQTTQLRQSLQQTGQAAISNKSAALVKKSFADITAESAKQSKELRKQILLLEEKAKLAQKGYDEEEAQSLLDLELELAEVQTKILDNVQTVIRERKMGAAEAEAQGEEELRIAKEINKEQVELTKTLARQAKITAAGFRVQSLKEEIRLLLIVNNEERRLAELRKEYADENKVQEIFNLEKIKKNIEDTRALIGDFVTQTSSDYKGFLKAVISGEDAVDALKQFQQGLKDRVLTIFLDFAMAPVEKFMKEAMEGIFLPKAPKGLKPEEEKAKTGIEGNTVATDENTTAIKDLTAALRGETATPPASSFGGAYNAGPAFDAANVFGGGGNLTGGIFDTIAQQMGDATESFDSFSAHMGKFVDSSVASADAIGSWGDSFNTQLSESLTKATDTTNTQGATFQESLGKAVGAIGIAAGAIMGIAAGIGQIKKGGTANVLGGIGSILTGIGGGMMGFMNMGKAANGAVWNGGFQAFANGGTVTGPTLGLIGEGKYNEAIVPLPDGRSIPVQMRGGSSRDLLNAPGTSPAAPTMLSMSFQSTTINGIEYVDRAQLEAAMAETRKSAARDGASRGASLALDRLQNSPSTRRRVGIR